MKQGELLEKYEVETRGITEDQRRLKVIELENKMILYSKVGGAIIASCVFGATRIYKYRVPSDIHSDWISMAVGGVYYYKGKKCEFSEAKKIEYQNIGMVCDR